MSDSLRPPWTAAHQASLSITYSQSLLRLMSIESVMPSNHLILCHPLLLPSIIPSIRVFSNESVLCISWPKDWSFSFKLNKWSVFPMNIQDWSPLGWTGWISLQSKGLSRVFSNTTVPKAWVLWDSAFFMVQLSHPYMTTGKTRALTRQLISKQRRCFANKGHLVKVVVFPVVMYRCESWTIKKAEPEELMLLSCDVGEDSWESIGQQGDQTN